MCGECWDDGERGEDSKCTAVDIVELVQSYVGHECLVGDRLNKILFIARAIARSILTRVIVYVVSKSVLGFALSIFTVCLCKVTRASIQTVN